MRASLWSWAFSRGVLAAVFVVVWSFPGAHQFTAQGEAETSTVAEGSEGQPQVPLPEKEEKPAPLPADLLHEHLALGKSAMGRSDWDTAKAEFEAVLEIEAEQVVALVNLGWIAQKEQLWVQSEQYLRRALKQSVEDGAVWLAVGVACLEQDKLEAAMAAFSQTVFLEPKNARAHRFLGITLGKRGWFDGAEQEMRKSLEIDPNDPGAHFNLAVFYLQRRPAAVELARRHYYKARDLGFAPDVDVEARLTKVASR